ncbi:MAG: hypothetical protein QOJ40_1682 [Verrucomicrobiota bacterium]|jgi:hypothetical protein
MFSEARHLLGANSSSVLSLSPFYHVVHTGDLVWLLGTNLPRCGFSERRNFGTTRALIIAGVTVFMSALHTVHAEGR